ncbi:integrin beta-1-binding protein 2 isoform X2 [Anolis carolinensis]|uniref:integrin beta-1-binding protein 2 isoform X2 n=1 Tax=Anolis carolinensis TaxID=28377 RepID=UPI002F2B4828
MALLCYNRGCGQRFDPEENGPDACLHHPGFPIFHDALKGWSCCRKRTTDFSEFLSIKGCTKGRHSNEKPPEPQADPHPPKDKAATEIIVQGPKSAEKMECERPSSDEPKQLLPVKVSKTLEQSLEKLDLSPKEEAAGQDSAGAALEVSLGTTCKNSGCKATFQGQESNRETCTFHPGVPVFHEGMKYWSCCGIKTTDFNAFLEQKGCSRGRHLWIKKQVDVHIVFEGDKVFQAELELWGVINVQKSAVSLLPSKVEITLQKAPPLTWARLEHPQSRAEPPKGPEVEAPDGQRSRGGLAEEESDDSLSWSSEEEDWEEGSAGPISPQFGGTESG